MALQCDDGRVFSRFDIAPRQHTSLLPKMMNAVLEEAGCLKSDLDLCAFCNGPGAFTGVRIAAATAQGIGIALNIPLVAVSTLATLAQVSIDRQGADSTLVALDARMGEVYWAVYRRENNIAQLTGEERIDKIDDVRMSLAVTHGAGHGWRAAGQVWRSAHTMAVDDSLLPDAASMLKLVTQAIAKGSTVRADSIKINYLRNNVAEKPSQ